MKNTHALLVALTFTAALSACKKEGPFNGGPVPGATTHPVRQWCDQNLADATQDFTVNANSGGLIMGTGGTRLVFLANAFRLNGVPVSGPVQVQLVEVLNVSDMVRMNKQTLGNDNGTLKMLSSGGEVKITATYNGQELGIVPNGVFVGIPGDAFNANMQAFTGTEEADGDLIWERTTETLAMVVDSSVVDTMGGNNWFWYTWQTDSLEWLNCDYFPVETLTQLSVDAPDGYDATNTVVWLVVPDLNGVLSSWYDNTLFQNWSTPIGYNAVIVGLNEENGSYSSSFTPITITAGMTVPISFTPTTLAQFEQDLSNL